MCIRDRYEGLCTRSNGTEGILDRPVLRVCWIGRRPDQDEVVHHDLRALRDAAIDHGLLGIRVVNDDGTYIPALEELERLSRADGNDVEPKTGGLLECRHD